MVKGKKKARVRPKAKRRVRRPCARRGKAKIRRPPARKTKALKVRTLEAALEKVGEVTHYFPKVKAAAVLVLKDGIKIGDNIYLKGHTTDFKQSVSSMQLDHVPIQEGKKGQEIGLLVKSRVRIGDNVYRI